MGGVTDTVKDWPFEAPWLSVTVRVMMCCPGLRVPLKAAPEPMAPSILETQIKAAPLRLPSSGSLPEPLKLMLCMLGKESPAWGLLMVAVGAWLLAGLTEMVRESLSEAPMLSVTVRVMVCCPVLRIELNAAPEPMAPSMLEAHRRAVLLRPPSSVSLPEPLKLMLCKLGKDAPPRGLLIVAVGA